MKTAQVKFSEKVIILILSIVVVVSGLMWLSGIHFSNKGKSNILNGVQSELKKLQSNIEEKFNSFFGVVQKGIEDAGSTSTVENISSMALTQQKKFEEISMDTIMKVSDEVQFTVGLNKEAVVEGLEDMLAASADRMDEIMTQDIHSIKMLARLAIFNLNAMTYSGLGNIRRFELILDDFQNQFENRQREFNDEMDKMLIQFILMYEKSSGKDDALIQHLIDSFENLKEVNSIMDTDLFDDLRKALDVQSKMTSEELKLVNQKVSSAINVEMNNTALVQDDTIDKAIGQLIETGGRIQVKLNDYNQTMTSAVDKMKTDLKTQLEDAGKEARSKIEHERSGAFSRISEARQQATERIDKSRKETNERFAKGIENTEDVIDDALNVSSKHISRSSLIIACMCIAVSLTLGLILIRMVTNPITNIISGLSYNSKRTKMAAEQVSESSHTLATSATQQAAAMQETSAALEQMSAGSRETMEMASSSEDLMKINIEKSARSLQSLVELRSDMNRIKADSRQMSQIMKSIDEIAFQTNLLALNAAVESARAGEAGSGFSVVAEEVRNLAKRAREAAENTQVLLNGTRQRVESAVDSIERINSDFEGVIESATQMGEKVRAITLASESLNKEIEQIAKSMFEIDQNTQQVAAVSEESNSFAEELASQSVSLNGFVDSLISVVGERNGSKRDISAAEYEIPYESDSDYDDKSKHF